MQLCCCTQSARNRVRDVFSWKLLLLQLCNGLFNFSTGDCNCNLRALDFLLQRCDLPVIGAAAQLSMQLEADNYANKTGHDSSEVACMGVQFLSSPMTLWRLCVPAGTSGSWQRASAAQQESVTMFHPRASAP